MEEIYWTLHEKLSRLQWLLHRHHMQTHAQHGPMADPTRGQGRVLAMLRLQPEITTKDLAYLLGIRQQSLNELLGKLEKAGYITRTPSEEDRRVMMVRLTEMGKTVDQPEEPDFSGIFDSLSEEEQAEFGAYLDRVIAALEEKVGSEEDVERMDWIRAARSRMGNETFDRMRHMRHGGNPFRGGFEGFGGDPHHCHFGGSDGCSDRPGPPPPPPPPRHDPEEE